MTSGTLVAEPRWAASKKLRWQDKTARFPFPVPPVDSGGPAGLCAVLVGSKIYVFGANRKGADTLEETLVAWVDTSTLTWQTKRLRRAASLFHSAVVFEDKILLFGGLHKKYFSPDPIGLLCFDLALLDFVPCEAIGNSMRWRLLHTAHVLESSSLMVVFGGRSILSYTVRLVRVLDIRRMKWVWRRINGELPESRERHSSCCVGDNIYVVGGQSSFHFKVNGLHVLQCRAEPWLWSTVKSSRPPGRHGTSLSHIDGKLILFGGRTILRQANRTLNSLALFDLNRNIWRKVGTESEGTEYQVSGQTEKREYHCAVATSNKLFVLGGIRKTLEIISVLSEDL